MPYGQYTLYRSKAWVDNIFSSMRAISGLLSGYMIWWKFFLKNLFVSSAVMNSWKFHMSDFREKSMRKYSYILSRIFTLYPNHFVSYFQYSYVEFTCLGIVSSNRTTNIGCLQLICLHYLSFVLIIMIKENVIVWKFRWKRMHNETSLLLVWILLNYGFTKESAAGAC